MRLNESGLSLFRSEEIWRRADNKVELESVDVCVQLAASPPRHGLPPKSTEAVESFFCLMSRNNEETAEFGAGSAAPQLSADLSIACILM